MDVNAGPLGCPSARPLRQRRPLAKEPARARRGGLPGLRDHLPLPQLGRQRNDGTTERGGLGQ